MSYINCFVLTNFLDQDILKKNKQSHQGTDSLREIFQTTGSGENLSHDNSLQFTQSYYFI